jgi:diguanylate cyclase (GGDEF)-like protein
MSSPRLLYVDDDRLIRMAFFIQFKRLGYEVDLAASAGEALQLVESRRYPVVVTDLRMPEMGGLELIDRFRVVSPETAFVVVTGLPELDLARDSFHDDAIVAVHSKPWNVPALHEAIERALAAGTSKTIERAVVIARDDRLRRALTGELEGEGFAVSSAPAVGAIDGSGYSEASLIVAEVSVLSPPRFTEMAELARLAPEAAVVVIGDVRSRVIARQALDHGAIDYCLSHEVGSRAFLRAVHYALEIQKSDRRVAEVRRTDDVTGLLANASFRAVVAAEVETYAPFGLVVIGFERFHAINDGLGHDAGDAFLRGIAQRLKQCAPNVDIGRLGNDEFALLLRGIQDPQTLTERAARLLDVVEEPLELGGLKIAPSARAGATLGRGGDADAKLRQAGAALRLAKQGGARVRLFTAPTAPSPSRFSLEAELRDALHEDRFLLHYQPQIELGTGALRGAEALLRMKRRDGTIVPPGQFIPVLEDTDLIVDVGAWVLRTACEKAREWHRAGHTDIRVSVNLSARQFEREGLVRTVLSAASDAGISPSVLELEITESLLMKDTELANSMLQGLKQIGAWIAIDDFGTGYSSLAYLHRFAVDVVKIDRSFVRTIGKEKAGGSIASAIIGLGHRLGLEVIAEGIETDEELAFLKNEGCDVGQGYFLGRPAELWAPPAAKLIAV